MAGPLLLGRLYHVLLPSLNGSLLRPVACVASSSGVLENLGPNRAPRRHPIWSAHRLVTGAAEPSLGSAPPPPRAAGESREVWQPAQQGSPAVASTAKSPCSLNRTEGESDALHRGAEPSAGTSRPDSAASPMDEVFKALQDMGLQPGRNCVVGDGLAEVDVGLYLNGVKVALELEADGGPRDRVLDARSYSMKRAMRSVLQAHGWHPVALKASDWRQLDGEQRTHYLAYCINHALGHGQSHHSHHHHHGHQCGHGHGHDHHHHHHRSGDGNEQGQGHGGCCGSGCETAGPEPK